MCQGEAWAWLRALALLLLLSSSAQVVWASESPDRECCEPLYPFIPPPAILTTTTTRQTKPPPEVLETTSPLPLPTKPPPVTSNSYVDVTIEQQEIATRPRPGKADNQHNKTRETIES